MSDLEMSKHDELLSVVLPTYGVEDYLAACLETVLQIKTLHEVIVVNDCSPDLSLEIAQSYANRDARVVVISNAENKGLGASRNVGARNATGKYLLFADSDDLLVPAAVDRMVETLEVTSSSFATAPADEFGRHKFRKRYWTTTSAIFRAGALRTTLEKHPELIHDHTAWTKVFRRTFWLDNGLEWAEGVKCEDVRASSKAYAIADAVDVVPAIAYLYRRRPGSITSTLSDDTVIGDWARETLAALRNVSGHDRAWQAAMQKVISVELRSRMAVYRRGLAPAEEAAFEDLLAYLASNSSESTLNSSDPETREALDALKPLRRDDVLRDPPLPGNRNPLLSVVMPTYNVEEWVGDTIKSILNGSWDNFELIVVDDGSSDHTVEIIRRFQEQDSRIRLFKNPGSGGAQARNFGADRAVGEYLIFVDGDDLISRQAFQQLIGSLESTGSQMAIGDFQKFWPTSTWQNSAAFGLAERKTGTTLVRSPKLIGNRTCWNRMFRTTFYREAGIHFPSSPRANDILPMTLAMSKAESIDVVPEIVYSYRARSGSSSMTSALGSAESLRGYFRQESLCAAVLSSPCPAPLEAAYWRTSLGVDGWGNLNKFVQQAPVDEEFLEVQESFNELWRLRPLNISQVIGDFKTVVYYMLSNGDFPAVRQLVNMETASKSRQAAATVTNLLLRVEDPGLRDSVLRIFHDWVLRPVIDDRGEWITDEVEYLVSLTGELSQKFDLLEAAVPETREPQVAMALSKGEENELWALVRSNKKPRTITLSVDAKDGNLRFKRDPSDDRIVGLELVEITGDKRVVPLFFTGAEVELGGSMAEKMAGAKWMPTALEASAAGVSKMPTKLNLPEPLKKSGRYRVTPNSVQILYKGLRRVEKSVEWRLRKSPDSLATRLIKRASGKD